MRYAEVADATYVGSIGGASGGWQRVFYTEEGKKADLGADIDSIFATIEKPIKTRLAFAALAPKGWDGERCWEGFNPTSMEAHGWLPVAWKESTHLDKTWVQFYMKEFTEKPAMQEQVSFKTHNPSWLPWQGLKDDQST